MDVGIKGIGVLSLAIRFFFTVTHQERVRRERKATR